MLLAERIKPLRLIGFDVDGVLTDGGLYLSDSGEEFKRFNSLDGQGLKMLKASGVELAIITGRASKCVELRARNLGITHLYQGVEDKLATMQALLEELNISAEAAAFMGDDVVDLPVMRRVGLALTVPGAPQIVRDHAHYVSQRDAGHGAVLEVCELILAAQNMLDAQLAPYLR
jgi:3-deoxy-D-manno-octulosonate 8-phosphate phosphatase (KDO 8-P phosphatase)